LTKSKGNLVKAAALLGLGAIVGTAWSYYIGSTDPLAEDLLTEARDCSEKKVRLYKFFINGDDGDPGESGEYQLRVDGRRYWPRRGGFTRWRMNQAHTFNGPWKNVHAHRSLTVGMEEEDHTSNDSASVNLSPK